MNDFPECDNCAKYQRTIESLSIQVHLLRREKLDQQYEIEAQFLRLNALEAVVKEHDARLNRLEWHIA